MQDILLFVHNHAMLSLGFAVVLVLLFFVEFARLKRQTNQLTPGQAVQLINHQDAAIVDVRNTDNFNSGHIVDAVSIPLSDITEKHKKLEKYKSKPIIVVCATGTDSPRAATQFAAHGYNVQILAGGMRAWRMADMPIVKG